MMYGNEGYSKNLLPHGAKLTGGGEFKYENGRTHLLKFTFSPGRFRVDVDGELAAEGTCKASESIRLRLRGGDDWSKGTTEFWDFAVETPAK